VRINVAKCFSLGRRRRDERGKLCIRVEWRILLYMIYVYILLERENIHARLNTPHDIFKGRESLLHCLLLLLVLVLVLLFSSLLSSRRTRSFYRSIFSFVPTFSP